MASGQVKVGRRKSHGRARFAVQQDAMSVSLADLLPDASWDPSGDVLLDRFLQYTAGRRLTLYPAQEEAILELLDGKNVVLNTPTGSGKSLVAFAMLFASLARGQRAVYTCPIKALVNEKWMGLCREFGPDQVGLSTGDATVNRGAPILCCTAEVLASIALRDGPQDYKRKGVIDRDWLYEQYVGQGRTLPDLAREKNMSTANMARVPVQAERGARASSSYSALRTNTSSSVSRFGITDSTFAPAPSAF